MALENNFEELNKNNFSQNFKKVLTNVPRIKNFEELKYIIENDLNKIDYDYRKISDLNRIINKDSLKKICLFTSKDQRIIYPTTNSGYGATSIFTFLLSFTSFI